MIKRHEVCWDRQNLLDRGFSPVSSFAYPEAAANAAAERMVRSCGYVSGRGTGNIYSDGICRGWPLCGVDATRGRLRVEYAGARSRRHHARPAEELRDRC